jgi:hypothetical protein
MVAVQTSEVDADLHQLTLNREILNADILKG